MKKVLIIIPVLIIVLVLVIGFSLNSIVKHGVETIGPKVMGATVKLSDADISIFSGKGKLKGLFIGNPEGFKSESALKVNEIRVALNVKSIFSEKIIIDEIYIDSPDITYEQGGIADNFKALLKNIEDFTGGSGGADQKESAEEPEKEEKKIQITKLTINNGKVNMSVTAMGGKVMTLSLPDIQMNDIGKDKEGTSLSKVMAQVFAVLNKNIFTSVAGSLKDIGGAVEGTVEETVGGAVDKLKGIFGK